MTTPFINLEYIFQRIYEFFTGQGTGIVSRIGAIDVGGFLVYAHFASYYIIFLLILAIIFLGIRLFRLKERERIKFVSLFAAGAIEDIKNERWVEVESHVGSDNSSDWRIAILEADAMLDELLDLLGYSGESLGEKLKIVRRGDFKTLDDAWEAHKVRNILAHEGSAYQLSHRQAKRVIDLYRRVFEEFNYI
ncbi:MAG: hypothetical protein HYS59_00320 [Candidatus Vogelbacteria bacterium]|nr:hypothetical protein [Candidatus Vogelbacteria bacterium]